jgi:hypothetical protein
MAWKCVDAALWISKEEYSRQKNEGKNCGYDWHDKVALTRVIKAGNEVRSR